MAHIQLKDVDVSFPIFTSHTRSVRTAIFSRLGGRIADHNDTVTVEALRGINLEISDGDRLGIVGHNGAGKTTLLRVISRVYEPTGGEAIVEGRMASFTDISLGMDPEGTGWENIIFRAVFMGATFAEARALMPAIAEFSELGDYLDLPVRTYSTGMFMRLAFAISTSVQPDIVVMDEMIGAGDHRFIQKAKKRISELLESSKILVLASHDVSLIRSLCNKAIWMDKGEIKETGPPDGVVSAYQSATGLP